MHNTRQWISFILSLVLMNTSCMALTTFNQATSDHRLHNSIRRTFGVDVSGDCAGGGIFADRIVAFYSHLGCQNACSYYFTDSGSFAGDHFCLYVAFGSMNASCGGISCGQLVGRADNDYRIRTFVNNRTCVHNCDAVCGK